MYEPSVPVSRGFSATHLGVDKAFKYGQAVPAVESGVVVLATYINPFANYPDGSKPTMEKVVAIQSNGFYLIYGHASDFKVSVGQQVVKGQTVILAGNTGYVLPKPTGPNDHISGVHCHMEERQGIYDGHYLDSKPVKDITPRLNNYQNTGGDDMFDDTTVRRAVEGAYGELLPSQHPAQDVLDSHVKAIQVAQGYGQFYKDIHAAMNPGNDSQKVAKYDQIEAIVVGG